MHIAAASPLYKRSRWFNDEDEDFIHDSCYRPPGGVTIGPKLANRSSIAAAQKPDSTTEFARQGLLSSPVLRIEHLDESQRFLYSMRSSIHQSASLNMVNMCVPNLLEARDESTMLDNRGVRLQRLSS